MTDRLTLAELAVFEQSIGAEFDGELHLYELQAKALIGMARRLLELESALEFLRLYTTLRAASDPRVLRDPIAYATELGWKGLTP